MMDLVIGSSGPISGVLQSRLKMAARDFLVVGRTIAARADGDGLALRKEVLGKSFANVFFLLSSLRVDGRHLSNSELEGLPEFEIARELLPQLEFKRLVFFSSAGAVYGCSSGRLVSEADQLRPISAYGTVKVKIEELISCVEYCQGAAKLILRIGNPFGVIHGSLFRYGLIPALLVNALQGETTSISVSIHHRKDFFAISILDDLLDRLLSDVSVAGVYNVGSGHSRSIADVCDEIRRSIGLAPRLELNDTGSRFDADSGMLDVSKLLKLVPFRPEYRFDTELRRTYDLLRRET
jgi:UDP-glucose 4-epimerase